MCSINMLMYMNKLITADANFHSGWPFPSCAGILMLKQNNQSGGPLMRCGFAIVLGAWLTSAVPSLAELPAICQRGATAQPIPLDFLLRQDALTYSQTVWSRMDTTPFDPAADAPPEDYVRSAVLAEAIEWPGALADAAAILPAKAHDLPWLLMLAEVENEMQGPVTTLLTQSRSILLPDLLPMMDRNGMTAQAAILREAMALFPKWELNPAERVLMLYGPDGEMKDQASFNRILQLDDAYPRDGAALTAARALIDSTPELKDTYQARLDALDNDARLEHLLESLRRECVPDWVYEEPEIERTYLSIGSPQAALLMMDDLAQQFQVEGTAAYWIYDSGAVIAPHLLRVLRLRGNDRVAEGLQKMLVEFPTPFPDVEKRITLVSDFPPETWERLDTAFPHDSFALLRADMLTLAVESGLLAPAP